MADPELGRRRPRPPRGPCRARRPARRPPPRARARAQRRAVRGAARHRAPRHRPRRPLPAGDRARRRSRPAHGMLTASWVAEDALAGVETATVQWRDGGAWRTLASQQASDGAGSMSVDVSSVPRGERTFRARRRRRGRQRGRAPGRGPRSAPAPAARRPTRSRASGARGSPSRSRGVGTAASEGGASSSRASRSAGRSRCRAACAMPGDGPSPARRSGREDTAAPSSAGR